MSTHQDFDQICALAVANGQSLASKIPVPKLLAWNDQAYDEYCNSQVFAAMDVFIPYLSALGVLGEQARHDILQQYINTLSAQVPQLLKNSEQACVDVLTQALQATASSSSAVSLESRDVMGAWTVEQWATVSRILLEDWSKPLPEQKGADPISLLDIMPPSAHKTFLEYCHAYGDEIAAARVFGSDELHAAVSSDFTAYAKEFKEISPDHYKELAKILENMVTPNRSKLVEASTPQAQVDLLRQVRSELLDVVWTSHHDLLQEMARTRIQDIAALTVASAQLACDRAAQVLASNANNPADTIVIEHTDKGPSLLTQYRQRFIAPPRTTNTGPRP